MLDVLDLHHGFNFANVALIKHKSQFLESFDNCLLVLSLVDSIDGFFYTLNLFHIFFEISGSLVRFNCCLDSIELRSEKVLDLAHVFVHLINKRNTG